MVDTMLFMTTPATAIDKHRFHRHGIDLPTVDLDLPRMKPTLA